MITKKHMIRAAEIAATFQGVKHTAIVDAFVLFFREENPRFDEGRFRTACGARTASKAHKYNPRCSCKACAAGKFLRDSVNAVAQAVREEDFKSTRTNAKGGRS